MVIVLQALTGYAYKCTSVIKTLCYHTFNRVFGTKQIPEQWSEIIISPIHKKGSKFEPNIYKAISLIKSPCKIVVHMLTKRLTNWCEDNNVMEESQAGFRS